jgi:hypothetical protein
VQPDPLSNARSLSANGTPGTGTEGSPSAVTFDPTGGYMLLEHVISTGPTTELMRVDLATGQSAPLNVSWAVDPKFAW